MLNDRDRSILRAVVDLYVADGEPVSSRRIQESGRSSMSTATIRNSLAELEREGYLAKPHVSSGRVPTDLGYRYYVDDVRSNRSAPEDLIDSFRSHLRRDTRDVGEIMLQTSKLLGSLSRQFSVVYGAIEQHSVVRGVRLVLLDPDRIMVVVNMEPEYERTAVLRFDREFSPAVVRGCEKLIGDLVVSCTLDEAKAALDAVVRDNVTDEGIIIREVSIRREAIFSGPPAVELYFEERSHVLETPELSDPKTLQLLLRLLHNKSYLTSILSERSPERTQVTIGHEHEDDALRPFALVTSGYRMGAARGVLGIIGPTRMQYERVLAVVEAASRGLRAIGEEYF